MSARDDGRGLTPRATCWALHSNDAGHAGADASRARAPGQSLFSPVIANVELVDAVGRTGRSPNAARRVIDKGPAQGRAGVDCGDTARSAAPDQGVPRGHADIPRNVDGADQGRPNGAVLAQISLTAVPLGSWLWYQTAVMLPAASSVTLPE